MDMPSISSPFFIAAAQPDQNPSIPGVFLPDLDMKQGSIAIAMRCPFVGSRKDLLNESLSKAFLKFWRNLLSHDLPSFAIVVKLLRPLFVRYSSIVSMKKVRKDLPKFVWLERAFETISLSWVRGLTVIMLTCCLANSKLVIVKHLSKLFGHYFRDYLTLVSALVLCRIRRAAKRLLTGCCITSD